MYMFHAGMKLTALADNLIFFFAMIATLIDTPKKAFYCF